MFTVEGIGEGSIRVSAPTADEAYRLFQACNGGPDSARRMGIGPMPAAVEPAIPEIKSRESLYPARVLAGKIVDDFISCELIGDHAWLIFGNPTETINPFRVRINHPDEIKDCHATISQLLRQCIFRTIERERQVYEKGPPLVHS